jgi:hypothetical protein
VLGSGSRDGVRWWWWGVSWWGWLVVSSELVDDCYLNVGFRPSSTIEPLDVLDGDFLVRVFLLEFFLEKFPKAFEYSDDHWIGSD